MSRVVLVLGRSAGGIGAHVRSLAAELLALGDDVRVVAPGSTHAAFELPGAVPWWPGRTGAGPTVESTTAVRRLLAGADAVHAHGHQAGVVAAALLAGVGRARPRLATSLHNELRGDPRSARHRLGTLAVRTALSRADLVTGASTDLVDLAEQLGARRAAIDEVPSPLVPGLLATDREQWRAARRDAFLRAHDLPVDRPVVLTVARVAPQKRLEDVLAVADLVTLGSGEGRASPFVVVGGGDDDLRRRLVSTAGPDVHLLGPSDSVVGWLLAADLFLLTSEWEARALVVQEAMAAGLPVVATRTGGLPGLVEGVGALAPVGDVDALAARVRDLLRDTQARREAGERGRERARTWPSTHERAARWHTWYEGGPDVP